MSIQITPMQQHFPLELEEMKLYGTGPNGKIYTKRFYTLLNRNFGIEIVLRNNTSLIQNLRITGCIYPVGEKSDEVTFKWHETKEIWPKSVIRPDYAVPPEVFTKMARGEYKIQFWVNKTKVGRRFFTIEPC